MLKLSFLVLHIVRYITGLLATLLLLIQYPLWLGQGGWLRVADLQGQVDEQANRADAQRARNARLAAEVDSLRQGHESVEERARAELSMIRNDEVYVQVLDQPVGAGGPNETARPAQQ
jgi:cell division protein FtsB